MCSICCIFIPLFIVVYEDVLKIIDKSRNESYILCGDYNLELDQEIDYFNYTVSIKRMLEKWSYHKFKPELYQTHIENFSQI